MATKKKASKTTGKRGAKPAAKPAAKRGTKPAAPAKSAHLTRVEDLVRILERSSLTELEYEDKEIVVRLSRAETAPMAVERVLAPRAAAAPGPMAVMPLVAPATPVDDPNVHIVRSPFVGTFYQSPSPEAGPFTAVGQEVTRGQTLCIVEAMKLMNEIESEVNGTVLEIMAENTKSVQYGQPLFRIAKKS